MKQAICSIGAILLVGACNEAPTGPGSTPGALAPAAAAIVVRGSTEVPLSGIMFGCDGELYPVEGTIESHWHNTQLASGHWQLSQQTRIEARGTGLTSGRAFLHRAVFNDKQVFAVPDGGAFTFDLVGRAHGITQGQSDNDFFFIHAKWTINATGEAVVDFLRIETQCRG